MPSPATHCLDIPSGLLAIARVRPDLAHLKLDQFHDRLLFRALWEMRFHREYPDLEWILSPQDVKAVIDCRAEEFFSAASKGVSWWLRDNCPTVLDLLEGAGEQTRKVFIDRGALAAQHMPPPLRLIWRDRSDLQALYNIHQSAGHVGLLAWWLRVGAREHPRVESLTDSALLQLEAPHGDDWPLPQFLSCILAARTDLSPQLYEPVSDRNWLNALLWWHLNGYSEFNHPAWSLSRNIGLRRKLFERANRFESNRSAYYPCHTIELPYPLFLFWSTRDDLQSLFDLRKPQGCKDLLAWWNTHGAAEYGNFPALFEDPDTELPGLNIIGFARSVIGIAEDVRMAARAATEANVPYSVIDAPMPGPEKLDDSLDNVIATQPAHAVSLYCLPPTELIRLGMAGGRSLLNRGNYNIGAWHWELPVWPAHLRGVVQSVNEIWTFTEFVRHAFSDLTDKPVIKMPLAVEVPLCGQPQREKFGMKPGRFYFLVMFDGNSWLSRKNPLAAIRAFKAAFSGNPSVGMMIKAISLDRTSAAWLAVEQELQGDDRVTVIDRALSRVELTQLMTCCDAYVSLHRSEGFGRIIAEAMLLRIPTITTNFSGNTDFCLDSTSYLVNGPLVSLHKEDYIFADGQQWCDPDLGEARLQMQRVRDDGVHRRAVVDAAQQLIQTRYSVKAVAHAYRERLSDLRRTHGL